MLWLNAVSGVDLSTPERRAGVEQTLKAAVATIADIDVRRHYETAIRERVAANFGGTRRPRQPGRRESRDFQGRRGAPQVAAGPSASLLSHPLTRASGRGTAPSLGEAVLLGIPLLFPEIGVERLESLAQMPFSGEGSARLASALAATLAESPGIASDALKSALEGRGHAAEIAAILEKLRRAGLRGLEDREQAAAAWDDAHHLRLRAGALSIERQAVAAALGREASDVHLVRLRDIQEQDQRSLRPGERGETEEAVIVHPFKRR
jgi:DNA primase